MNILVDFGKLWGKRLRACFLDTCLNGNIKAGSFWTESQPGFGLYYCGNFEFGNGISRYLFHKFIVASNDIVKNELRVFEC